MYTPSAKMGFASSSATLHLFLNKPSLLSQSFFSTHTVKEKHPYLPGFHTFRVVRSRHP